MAGPARLVCGWLVEHFRRHRAREPWPFVRRVAPESLGVCLALALIMWALGVPEREIEIDLENFILYALALAPAVETLAFQALPVFVARRCRARFSVQIAASVVPFALVHVLEGLGTGLAAGLVGGFYFAFTYAHWRENSRWTAFWTTWAVHTFQNAVAVTLALASGEL